ncbi:mercury(II) reductase [Salicibibacter cibarius]|uniref:Mercuric reductase n=2 Tax=Salicibibacter TaxID=2685905 RepID=A0A514LL23_9BACI|nr:MULTISPECIES: mercury(II) reductase [Salicibibacter]QDI91961.1 mercury(II) reductase [Salicibibacter halophilus]QQK74495.1 mercury(II) reductase [Salicibibacter cibarius]
MNHIHINIQGMTCTGCEEQIAVALENIGAKHIDANYPRGDVTFKLPKNVEIETAKKAIDEAKYQPGQAQILQRQEKPILDDGADYDFLIIGSGAAAFSSAIKASETGAKVAMVERSTVGGTCVNIGCVPSKTMLRAGEINGLAQNTPFSGLQTSAGPADLAQLTEQKDELVTQMRQEKYIDLIDEYGFDLVRGEAEFIDDKTIQVNGQSITAKSFLIATGAPPDIPAIPGMDMVDYLTSTTALELKEMPKRLAVIGSGYIATELGQMFHNLGTEVTLMQRSERLFNTYDPEISEAIGEALIKEGLNLITGVTYLRVEQKAITKNVYIEVNGEEQVVEADQILVATGRNPNTKALNLEAAGVKTGKKGEVQTDEYLQTTNNRIYAAGDVTLGPQFVYVAAYEGEIVAGNVLGLTKRKIDLRFVPGVIFTKPSMATVGLTEQQAKERGYDVKTSVLPLDAVPRALVNYETTGVYKLVVDTQTRKLIGAHIVSENAGDVIYGATLAVQFGLTIEDLTNSFVPYLTMAEGLKLAALAFDRDVSKLSCCAG